MLRYLVVNDKRVSKEFVAAKVGKDTDLVAVIVDERGRVAKPSAETIKAADRELINFSYEFSPIESVLHTDDKSGLMILRLVTEIGGDAVLMRKHLLDAVYFRIGKYYILPSSIHEVLCARCSDMEAGNVTAASLKEMVQNINVTTVYPGERLSDHVYVYDGYVLRIAA